MALLENVRGVLVHLLRVIKTMKNALGSEYNVIVAPLLSQSIEGTYMVAVCSVRAQICYTKLELDAAHLSARVRRPRVWFLLVRSDLCRPEAEAS